MAGILFITLPAQREMTAQIQGLLAGSFTRVNILPEDTPTVARLIDEADIVLNIVGPAWAQGIAGQSAAYTGLEHALTRPDLPVINVPLDNAQLPTVDVLPVALKPIAYTSTIRIDTENTFRRDVATLAREIAGFLRQDDAGFDAQVRSETMRREAEAKRQGRRIPINLILIGSIFAFALFLILSPQVEENARRNPPLVDGTMAPAQADDADLALPDSAALVIGFAGGLSGSTADRGETMLNGVQLALAERGIVEIAGTPHPVDLLAEDAACSGLSGQRIAERFVERGDVLGVIGHMCNQSCTVALPVYETAGIPIVSPGCNTTALSLQPSDSFYRVIPSQAQEAEAIAAYLFETYGETVALIYDEQDYARQFAEIVQTEYATRDATLNTVIGTETGVIDYTALAETAQANAVDAVYFAGRPANAAGLRAELPDLPLIISVGGNVPAYIEAAGDSADGTRLVQITPPDTPDYAALRERYTAEFDAEPESPIFAYAYDATNVLLDALTSGPVAEDNGTLVVDYAILRDTLANYTGQGVTGEIDCTDNGDCAAPAITFFTIQDGNLIEDNS
jgi:branched-chain amino acid transport system substrate-binding protein